MKEILFLATSFFVMAVVIGLAQLWFEPWSVQVFVKIEITLGSLFLIILAIWFAKKEYKEYQKQKNGD